MTVRSPAPEPGQAAAPVGSNSPDLVIAMRLLDYLKACGFEFRRVALGEDAPLVGNRVSDGWIDLVHIEGFSRDCFAWRKRISSLISVSRRGRRLAAGGASGPRRSAPGGQPVTMSPQ